MKNASVTKKISHIIQGDLPIGVPKPLKDEYTAKSVRRGAVSCRNYCSDVCGRTGHHLMNNAESYVDERNASRASVTLLLALSMR